MFTKTKLIHTVAVITASAVFILAALLTGGILLFPLGGEMGMQQGAGGAGGSGFDNMLGEGDFWDDVLGQGQGNGNGDFWGNVLDNGSGLGGMLPEELIGSQITVARIYSDVTDAEIYLRRQSYGDFDGQAWSDAPTYHNLIYGTHAATYLPSYAIEAAGGAEPTYVEIDLTEGFDQYLIPYYTATSGGDYTVQVSDSACSDGADTYGMYYYDTELVYGDRVGRELADYEAVYRQYVYANYLTVDDESRGYLEKIIKAEGLGDSRSIGEIVAAVAEYVQNAAVYNLKYNTELDAEENTVIAFLDTYKEGVCRHYAASATLMYRTMGIPARYTEGFLAETQADTWQNITADQAHAWVEVYLDGLGWVPVEVTGSASGPSNKIPLTLYPITVEAQYDPYNPITLAPPTNELKGFEQYAEQGYTLKANITGSLDTPGKVMSTLESVTIYDPDGNDVTDSFEILRGTGQVHLYRDVIEYQGENDEKVYDGTVLSVDDTNCHYVSGTLERGHTATVVPLNGIIHVGVTSGRYRIAVTDKYGNDVSGEYKYVCRTGTVRITPASLTLTAGSATKPYDGSPLTYDGIPIYDPWALVKGDFIDYYVISGSQTEIGISETRIEEIRIMREIEGELVDVTQNYAITLEKGTLKVTIPK